MAGCGATGEQHIQVISGPGNPTNFAGPLYWSF